MTLVRHRLPILGWWVGGILITGAFWFVRNWIRLGNPLPWTSWSVGPLHAAAVVPSYGGAPILGASVFDGGTWEDTYRPGLRHGFGPVWPIVVATPVVTAVAALWRRTWAALVVGVVVLAGVVGYLVTPATAGLTFVYNLRVTLPTLAVAAAGLPLLLSPTRAARLGLAGGLAVVAVASATVEHRERIPAWPSATVPAIVVVVLGAGLTALVARSRPRSWPPVVQRTVAAISALVLIAVGYGAEERFGDQRYLDRQLDPTPAALTAWYRDVHDARIVVWGSVEVYPAFGLDLSNLVTVGELPARWRAGDDECERWLPLLAGSVDYVVLTPNGLYPLRPPEWIFDQSTHAQRVFGDGDHAVYRLDGPLTPGECAPP